MLSFLYEKSAKRQIASKLEGMDRRETLRFIVHNFFLSCGMICVPGEINGVSAVAGGLGDILKQPERLAQAEVLGKNVLAVAAKMGG